MNNQIINFANIDELVSNFRTTLETKKYILLYAFNGTGKTRLSMAFKEAGKQEDQRDTLYFNAFTEDLFVWDNDLENDTQRTLQLNDKSRFFRGLEGLDIGSLINSFLGLYADFDFTIDYEENKISFSRQIIQDGRNITIEDIKISRGEENTFIWCFYLAIAQLAIDANNVNEADIPYSWVKYLYIDDPASSLDDNNVVMIANHLGQLLKATDQNHKVKTIVSTHHSLFFNVMCNELSKSEKYMLFFKQENNQYELHKKEKTSFFYHLVLLKELQEAKQSGQIHLYHFAMLRILLEKAASFHGYSDFSEVMHLDNEQRLAFKRIVNAHCHGFYPLFESDVPSNEDKEHFKNILIKFTKSYRFNPEFFPEETT